MKRVSMVKGVHVCKSKKYWKKGMVNEVGWRAKWDSFCYWGCLD